MSPRIFNKLDPNHEGDLYGSMPAAQAAIQQMLQSAKGRGWAVTKAIGENPVEWKVVDAKGTLKAIYSIEQ